MKIIAIHDIPLGVGGAFDQSCNSLRQFSDLSVDKFEFEILTTYKQNLLILNSIGLKAQFIKISIWDKLFSKIFNNPFWHLFQTKAKLISSFEKNLIKKKCSLALFISPSNLALTLQKINFITTFWDLAFRENVEFSEVRDFNNIYIKDSIYRSLFIASYFIITNSEALVKSASFYYGIPHEKFLVIPFKESIFLEKFFSRSKKFIKNKYKLKENFLFYPAQFWHHKNHIRILQSLVVLKNKYNYQPKIIFCGNDFGSLETIKNFVTNNKLSNQVIIFDYLPSEEMRAFYELCSIVVFPTYFGPTNLPIYEAWSVGKPLIYSKKFMADVYNGAFFVDIDNPESIANAILKIHKNIGGIKTQLISNGRKCLKRHNLFLKKQESMFISRIKCFQNTIQN